MGIDGILDTATEAVAFAGTGVERLLMDVPLADYTVTEGLILVLVVICIFKILSDKFEGMF